MSRTERNIPLSPDDLARFTDVSRETLARLKTYADILVQWQSAINLVAPSTLADLWRRHFFDSAQLLYHAPKSATTWIDLGSGAGFPGLVLAIMGVEKMHLVESNRKKCEFLRQVSFATNTPVVVHAKRIEDLRGVKADVVISRALAPLHRLLDWAEPFAYENTVCLFLKGQQVVVELTDTAKYWNISYDLLRSETDSSGVVVRVKGFRRVAGAS